MVDATVTLEKALELIKKPPLLRLPSPVSLQPALNERARAFLDKFSSPEAQKYRFGVFEGQASDIPWEVFWGRPAFRKHQRETLVALAHAFRTGKRFVILQGPTGSGKSVIGMAIAAFFGSAFASTSQRMLQDQYIKDFIPKFLSGVKACTPLLEDESDGWLAAVNGLKNPKDVKALGAEFARCMKDPWSYYKALGEEIPEYPRTSYLDPQDPQGGLIVNLKGKRNYWCARFTQENGEPLFNVAEAPCQEQTLAGKIIKGRCRMAGICPFFAEYGAAKNAPLTVMNFSNLMLLVSFYRAFEERPLLLIDEAHCLEDAIIPFAEITFTQRALSCVSERLPPDAQDILAGRGVINNHDEAVALVREQLEPAVKQKLKLSSMENVDWDGSKEEGAEGGDEEEEDRTGGGLTPEQQLKELSAKISRFLAYVDDGGIVEPQPLFQMKNDRKVPNGYTFKPLTAASLGPKVFRAGEKVLLMSATILDPKAFCRGLGIKEEEAEFIDVPSTFPKENHPFLFQPVGKMGSKYVNETLPKLAEKLEAIFEKHGEEKGLVHTVNFAPITEYLEEYFEDNDRVLIYTPGTDKFELIEEHLSSPEPTILIGPGFNEGLDLKDDLCRFLVFCKVPFLNLGDRVVFKRKELDPEWYAWRSALSLVQADGRAVRSETDWATTYMLDADFEFFWHMNKKILPKHFRRRVKHFNPRFADKK